MAPVSDDDDSSLPIPAIAACAAVGCIIFIFLVVRIGMCIHRRRKFKPVPLPPARPLSAIHTLPWNANASASKVNLSSPSLSPTAYHPDLLITQNKSFNGSVYRQYSQSTLNVTEEMPLRQPPSPVTPVTSPVADAQLIPPQPSFFVSQGNKGDRSSAQLSLYSATDESDGFSYPPQRAQSAIAFPTTGPSDESTSSRANYPSVRNLPTPNSSPRTSISRSRRLSVAASVTSMQTTRSMRSTRSMSTVRGPPHRPYSRVDIVLPAPLAPHAQPYYLREMNEGGYDMAGSNRQSVCDPWLRIGRENTSTNLASRQSSGRERSRPRYLSAEAQTAPRPRPYRQSVSSISSITTNSTNLTNPYLNTSRRSSSISSRSSSLRQKPSLDMSQIPPVPRVPSIYYSPNSSPNSNPNSRPSSSHPSPVLALSDSITGNCKLRWLESGSTITDKAALSNSESLAQSVTPSIVESSTQESISVQAY